MSKTLEWFGCPVCGCHLNDRWDGLGEHPLMTLQWFGGRQKGGKGICDPPQGVEDSEVREESPEYYEMMMEVIRDLCARFNMVSFERRPPGSPPKPRKPKVQRQRRRSVSAEEREERKRAEKAAKAAAKEAEKRRKTQERETARQALAAEKAAKREAEKRRKAEERETARRVKAAAKAAAKKNKKKVSKPRKTNKPQQWSGEGPGVLINLGGGKAKVGRMDEGTIFFNIGDDEK